MAMFCTSILGICRLYGFKAVIAPLARVCLSLDSFVMRAVPFYTAQSNLKKPLILDIKLVTR